MPPTMRDVARLAGVSVKTVSNVVNNTYPYIRPETRARVEAAMDELGYRLNVAARQLRTNRTGIIGLAVPELRLPYFAELADEVIRAASERGLRVIVEQVEPVEHVAVGRLIGSRTYLLDGAIIAPAGHADVPSQSAPTGFPVVVLGDHRMGDGVDQVYLANTHGAHLAVTHLLDAGSRRIIALGPQLGTIGNAAERARGYYDAIRNAGISPDSALVRATEGWAHAAAASAIERALAEGLVFDGVFAFNDSLALGAMAALARNGRMVPSDVRVVGFDDIDDAQFSSPSLSSVTVDRSETAGTAVRLLVDRLVEEKADPPRAVEIPARLTVRDSTR